MFQQVAHVSGMIYILEEMHKNGTVYKEVSVVHQHAVNKT